MSNKIWIASNTNPITAKLIINEMYINYIDINIPNYLFAEKDIFQYWLSRIELKCFTKKEYNNYRFLFTFNESAKVQIVLEFIKKFIQENLDVQIVEIVNPDPNIYCASRLINEAY